LSSGQIRKIVGTDRAEHGSTSTSIIVVRTRAFAKKPKARKPSRGIAFNEHHVGHGDVVYQQACKLGCEGIVSKRLGSLYRSGRSKHWLKVKNPAAPAVRREAEEDWGR
jgi:hypothetical protein